jgi:hypothetical protein
VAGALPAEEYKMKLEQAGFADVNVTITKPHALNMEVVKRAIEDLTTEDLDAMDGISASALITASKQI